MANPDWFQWAREGGAYLSPFLLGALVWMDVERRRLLKENSAKDVQITDLAKQSITLSAEIKTFLFSERKAS